MAVLAPCLVTLRAEVNAKWPMRGKASDGWIGDVRHCGGANPTSDHCAVGGIVRAVDITNDPAHGLDAGKLAETLKGSGDKRLKYIISNGRIWNPTISPAWRKYTGANAHTKHVHVSCVKGTLENSTVPWPIDGIVTAPVNQVPVVVPQTVKALLKKGSKGTDVARLQTLLNANGAKLIADGDFGKVTHEAVLKFQKAKGLLADGKVGPKTWAALEAKKAPEKDQDKMPATTPGADFDKVVKHYEGKVAKVYELDGVLHGGWGHALAKNSGWKAGDPVSDQMAEAWLLQDRKIATERLLKHIAKPLNQAQFDAVASIIWNGGDGPGSPLYYHTKNGILANVLNAGDYAAAADVIVALGQKPTKSGKVFRGIINRRLTEAELFRGEAYKLR